MFVDFFGWFKDGTDIFLAMEHIPLGDLEKNVIACSGSVQESEARDIAEQILLALEIMHAESFAHRDLKPQVIITPEAPSSTILANLVVLKNILVVHGPPKWWVKVADFGLSKRLTELQCIKQ